MYKTIVVPLDGSEFAEQAIGTAVGIAQRSGAHLVLVRVHETYTFEATDYSRSDDMSRRDQEQYLATIAERVETEFGITPERSLLEGVVTASICDFALATEAPLIVISTHGRTGFSRFWLGSIADAIVRSASAPVLMLRHRNTDTPDISTSHRFEQIIVPLDGSSFAELAVPYAVALADAFKAKLTLLRVVAPINVPTPLYAAPYVAPPIEEDEEALNLRIAGAEHYVREVANRIHADLPALDVALDVRVDESPAASILDAAKAHGVDTVALATHGRGQSRLVVASVADKVLRAGPAAVLIVRPGVVES